MPRITGVVGEFDFVHASGGTDVYDEINFLTNPILPVGSLPKNATIYGENVVAEATVITVGLGSTTVTTATGTLQEVVFSGTSSPVTPPTILRLIVQNGPYRLTVPTCLRLGTADSISNVQLVDGSHEFSWVFSNDNFWLADSLPTGGIVQRISSANTTTNFADANRQILHPASDNNPRTFTIDSNANVAYDVGTVITFVNLINTVTIAITSDTLLLAGTATTGSRTLAVGGIATALKVASTYWVISGPGLT